MNLLSKYRNWGPSIKKLDGVGPVDNRPSTDTLHYLVQLFFRKKRKKLKYYKKKIFTCDR